MIRIQRPVQPPAVLLGAGRDETSRNCDAYDLSAEAYRSRAARFRFRRSIFAHTSVKAALLAAQHEKCCYCESKFPATSPGAVEHFRPKGAVRPGHGEPNTYPGYYWLAYTWENLLVSCETCNTSKGTLFPLLDEHKRARSHHDTIEVEPPVFIDPAGEDPADHIRFRRAEVVHLTDRGLATIKGCGLRRSKLESEREEHLELLEALYDVTARLDDDVAATLIESARALLGEKTRPEARFSAMARDFLDARAGGVESR